MECCRREDTRWSKTSISLWSIRHRVRELKVTGYLRYSKILLVGTVLGGRNYDCKVFVDFEDMSRSREYEEVVKKLRMNRHMTSAYLIALRALRNLKRRNSCNSLIGEQHSFQTTESLLLLTLSFRYVRFCGYCIARPLCFQHQLLGELSRLVQDDVSSFSMKCFNST